MLACIYKFWGNPHKQELSMWIEQRGLGKLRSHLPSGSSTKCRSTALQHLYLSSLFSVVLIFEQELAQKIKGYQEQIGSLNSKCKMLAVKAKHATMLLTVSDVEGLPEEMDEEKAKKSSAQAVMVREHNIPHNIVTLTKLFAFLWWHCVINKALDSFGYFWL